MNRKQIAYRVNVKGYIYVVAKLNVTPNSLAYSPNTERVFRTGKFKDDAWLKVVGTDNMRMKCPGISNNVVKGLPEGASLFIDINSLNHPETTNDVLNTFLKLREVDLDYIKNSKKWEISE